MRSALLLVLLAAAPAAAQDDEQPEHTTLVYPPFAHTLGIHRARPHHLKLFLGDRTRFDDPQGLAAVKFATDDDPERKGDDYQLTLFGVNSGRGELLYNSSMQTLAIYGGEGDGEGRFREPHGIAATVDGRIYVADTGNRRIVRLRWDPTARALRWAGAWPVREPRDVATDARGQAWAADREAGAVLRLADSSAGAGTPLLPPSPIDADRWPLPADVELPIALAIGDSLDPWYRPHAYRLYLVDRDGRRLRAYDAAGAVLAETTPAALGRPAGAFAYVALDYYGNVYATDVAAGVVSKLDPLLRPLASFAGPGPADAALEEPRGIAIWRRFGQVFVAERDGARYFFLGTDFHPLAEPLTVDRSPSRYAIRLFMTEAATLTLTFLDASGDTLAVAEPGVALWGEQDVGWGPEAWRIAPPEEWEEQAVRVGIEARPTYSSRKRFSRIEVHPFVWSGP